MKKNGMTKWTLPEGRKPMTNADLAGLTQRLGDTAVESSARVAALEAKLDTAISALTRIAEDCEANYVALGAIKHDAHAAIAELKGETE